MFDIGWSELLIVAVIAIIVVGPRDLPRMLRTLGQYTRKMRSMAGEFKTQFNDAMEEADLGDLKKDVESLRSMDPLKGVKDELSPFKDLGSDLKNAMEAPAPEDTKAENTIAAPTATPKKTVKKSTTPKPKTTRKSSPRAAAQTNRSGSTGTKTTKAVTARKTAKKTPKPVAAGKKKTDKPVKGEAV